MANSFKDYEVKLNRCKDKAKMMATVCNWISKNLEDIKSDNEKVARMLSDYERDKLTKEEKKQIMENFISIEKYGYLWECAKALFDANPH